MGRRAPASAEARTELLDGTRIQERRPLSQARRATIRPQRRFETAGLCASESTTSLARGPRETRLSVLRSRRSTWLLISTATPCPARRRTRGRLVPVAVALEEAPAGRVREDVDPGQSSAREGDRSSVRAPGERRVDRRNHDVDAARQSSARSMRHPDGCRIRSREQRDAIEAIVERANPRGVLQRTRARRGRWPSPATGCDR